MIIISYEALEQKFQLDGKYYWKLYPGQQYRVKRFAANLEVENKEESWSMLMDQLQWVTERYVTIETLSSPVAKNGNVYIIDLGNSHVSTSTQQGIGSTGQGSYYQGAGMNPIQLMERSRQEAEKSFALQLAMMEDRLKKDFEILQLKQRLEEAEDALENGLSFKDKIGNALADHLPMIVGMFSKSPMPAAQVGVAGVNDKEMPQEKTTPQAPQQPQLSVDKMMYDVVQLQQLFPEYNMNEVLHGLLNLAQQNPGQIRGLLGMVAKPISNG